jgi:hypothetical protein
VASWFQLLTLTPALLVLLLLAQGKHTLTLAFANALHESYGPTYMQSIEVNVK